MLSRFELNNFKSLFPLVQYGLEYGVPHAFWKHNPFSQIFFRFMETLPMFDISSEVDNRTVTCPPVPCPDVVRIYACENRENTEQEKPCGMKNMNIDNQNIAILDNFYSN